MTDMIELVIKVSEKDWKFLKESDGCRWSRAIIESVINGNPLPKGHGNLIDADEVYKEMLEYYDDCARTSIYTKLGFETSMGVIEDAPIIIEAYKTES